MFDIMVSKIKGDARMDSIVLYNQNGQNFNVDVIRYFKPNDNKYLVFGLKEIDENNYIQLYLTKVENVDGKIVMNSVSDEAEWGEFGSIIKKIVANNRNNIPNDNDLDYKELDGKTVSSFRIFKLKNDIANILASNKNPKLNKIEEPVITVEEQPTDLQDASARDTGLTIEEILKKVSEGAKNAREETKVILNKEVEEPKKEEKIETSTNDEFENIEPKVINEVLPTVSKVIDESTKKEDIDYEAKYKDALSSIELLEDENMRLINELVEAKAKLATIKDIL